MNIYKKSKANPTNTGNPTNIYRYLAKANRKSTIERTFNGHRTKSIEHRRSDENQKSNENPKEIK